MHRKITKNCGKCWYSERNIENLSLTCKLNKTIKNTWTTADKCEHYACVTKRKPTIQLKLNLD